MAAARGFAVRRRCLCSAGASSTLAILATFTLGVASTRAETLADALALAYQTNPTLQQARAQQRALDETSVQARAGWRPQIGVTASDDYEHVFSTPGVSVNTGGATLNVTQPIYTSGRTAATVRSADASVEAGRESLRATEASVLLSVIQAYEDVLRDQTILAIRQDDVAALSRVLDEVSAKRAVGQITRTDVLQIQSQQSTAQSNLAGAQAQLQNSRAEYAAAVGQNPGTLAPPPTLPQLPKDVDNAFDAAETDNPNLRAAKFNEKSSREKIAQARAGLGPTVAVGAQVGYSGSTVPAQTVDYSKAVTAQVTVTQPIFTGGTNTSLIRQAIEQNAADRIGVEKARRQVVQGVAQAWNQTISIERMKGSDQSAYDAAKLELEGMQEEYKVALRSTLEVLSADEALRSAELNLATADHDGYLAQANLLELIGRLEAGYIVNGAPIYDPKTHFDKVKGKGATPYEPLIAGLDNLSIGHAGKPKPIEAPEAPAGPPSIPEGTLPAPDAPLTTASPVLSPAQVEHADLEVKPHMLPGSPPTMKSAAAVQIGAFPTMALAEEGWAELQTLVPDQMREKAKVLESVQANGSTLYRTVVVGFDSYSAAGRFCDALKSKGRVCFVKSSVKASKSS